MQDACATAQAESPCYGRRVKAGAARRGAIEARFEFTSVSNKRQGKIIRLECGKGSRIVEPVQSSEPGTEPFTSRSRNEGCDALNCLWRQGSIVQRRGMTPFPLPVPTHAIHSRADPSVAT